jgi:hypothetical protein
MNVEGPALLDELISNNLPSNLHPVAEEVRAFISSLFPIAVDVLVERLQIVYQNATIGSSLSAPSLISSTQQITLRSDSGYSTSSLQAHNGVDSCMPAGSFAEGLEGQDSFENSLDHFFDFSYHIPPLQSQDLLDSVDFDNAAG